LSNSYVIMSSFLSNLASGTSTREVVEELEQTKKKLEKSQVRLTKLSGAYRALHEEKKTLEATITAITSPSESTSTTGTAENAESNEASDAEPANDHTGNPKIAQLTAALAQMSAERAKMQETFQLDRKKLKIELEAEVGRLSEALEATTVRNGTLAKELKQGDQRLRDSVRGFEAENSASKIANRELQKQLNQERKNRDEAEAEAKRKSEMINALKGELKESHEKHRERANDTRLEELKSKYLQLDTRYKQKNAEVDKLIESLKLVEMETAKKLDMYSSKTDESKLAIKAETKKKEARVAELEDKISDLTELCAQLEKEKVGEQQKNISSLRVIDQLRNEIDDKCTGSVTPTLTNDYFELYMQSQDEVKQIMTELDEKKVEVITLRAELADNRVSKVKNKASVHLASVDDTSMRQLKSTLVTSQRRIEQLELEKVELTEVHQKTVDAVTIEATRKCADVEVKMVEKFGAYEEQLSALRERSQKILSDKEAEMEIMQKELNELTSSKTSAEGDSFTQLLSKEDSNLDTSIIMYAEQLARKDVEINTLRAKRKELEERIRSVQEKLAEVSADTLDWKEKFETLERDSSPASKEYLKNLVLQYLAVSDKSKKASMQMALMTILELTSDDIKQMKRKMNKK